MVTSRRKLNVESRFTSVELLESRRLMAAYALLDTGALNNGDSDVLAADLNQAGQVVARVILSDGIHTVMYSNGVLADIGSLGGVTTDAPQLNNLGQIAGYSSLPPRIVNGVFQNDSHGFLYSSGLMNDLGTFGGFNSVAADINDAGHVVGGATLADGTTHAFLYQNGSKTDLGTFGGIESYASAINKNDQILGGFTDSSGVPHLFRYTAGQVVDLGTLGGTQFGAAAMNSAGQVAGYSFITDDVANHAFLYSGSSMIDLGTLGGNDSFANAINDAGQVVGVSATTPDGNPHGFLYSNGTMKDLGALGTDGSYAYTLNSSGVVVGDSQLPDGGPLHAFVYRNGAMSDLNNLIPANSGYELVSAKFVNDGGQILCDAIFGGRERVVLLTPGNSPPVARNDSAQTVEDNPVNIAVLTNDSDADGDLLKVMGANGAQHGTVTINANGTLTYRPNRNFFGTDQLNYQINDGQGGTASASVTIKILSPAQALSAATTQVLQGLVARHVISNQTANLLAPVITGGANAILQLVARSNLPTTTAVNSFKTLIGAIPGLTPSEKNLLVDTFSEALIGVRLT